MLFPISGAGMKPAKEVARKPARSAGRTEARASFRLSRVVSLPTAERYWTGFHRR